MMRLLARVRDAAQHACSPRDASASQHRRQSCAKTSPVVRHRPATIAYAARSRREGVLSRRARASSVPAAPVGAELGLLQSWETGGEHVHAFSSATLVLSDHEPERAIVRRLFAQVPVALIPGAGGKVCF